MDEIALVFATKVESNKDKFFTFLRKEVDISRSLNKENLICPG